MEQQNILTGHYVYVIINNQSDGDLGNEVHLQYTTLYDVIN